MKSALGASPRVLFSALPGDITIANSGLNEAEDDGEQKMDVVQPASGRMSGRTS